MTQTTSDELKGQKVFFAHKMSITDGSTGSNIFTERNSKAVCYRVLSRVYLVKGVGEYGVLLDGTEGVKEYLIQHEVLGEVNPSELVFQASYEHKIITAHDLHETFLIAEKNGFCKGHVKKINILFPSDVCGNYVANENTLVKIRSGKISIEQTNAYQTLSTPGVRFEGGVTIFNPDDALELAKQLTRWADQEKAQSKE